ncbi:lipocalin family protein [Arcicella rosea]|uniref:Lipocalin-like domain-containing protein n=1 Tax=Arcicella rosea TaxID=502909 RepID=A0A841EGB7_9BACT|nr:lipocalin family protein [Arcicella rosea]MBB6002392.1 hypothetical protein [Arcicella rosea]
MKKLIKLTATMLILGSVVYACKVKQQQPSLSYEIKQAILPNKRDALITEMLAKNWVINVVNYQADTRKNVLYERGVAANLHDYSKESFKLTTEERVDYTDGAGKIHHGTWTLRDDNTKLLMTFEDGEEITWSIVNTDKNHLDLHLAIDANKVKWDIHDLNQIDISTAVVLAGFYAGIVDEDTEKVNVTYRMMPRS